MHYALGHGPRETVPPDALVFSKIGADWVLAYSRPSIRLGVAYDVESSTDLVIWSTDNVTHQLASSADGIDTWRGSVPVGAPRVFLRLKVAEQ